MVTSYLCLLFYLLPKTLVSSFPQVIKKVPKKKETPVLDVSQCTFHVSHSLQHLPAWGQRELVLGAISSRKCTLITGSPGVELSG